jgi:uncharacterized protein
MPRRARGSGRCIHPPLSVTTGIGAFTKMGMIDDDEGALRILRRAHRVAVLGIKPESKGSAPAHYVAAYLQRAGMEIVPVPVYYPEAQTILGERVYRNVADIPGDLDLVLVFRRSGDIMAHLDDIIAKQPRAAWFQLGIRNTEAARRLAEHGIDVVQDRCAMIDHRRI